MSKISLIIQREYLTRVRKKSFIIMTILGPILTLGIYLVPILMATSTKDLKTVAVLDQTKQFTNTLKNTEEVVYAFQDGTEETLKKSVLDGTYDALLVIPSITPEKPEGIKLISSKNLSLDFVSDIREVIEKDLKAQKLKLSGISEATLAKLDVDVNIDTKILDQDAGKESDSSSAGATIAGFAGAFLIYLFIFLYGVQVLRGVIEEKTSRIIEVMISSVKPFELMMGKVVGIALVGLTQFVVWISLSYLVGAVAVPIVAATLKSSMDSKQTTIMANIPNADQNSQVAQTEPTNSAPENPMAKVTKIIGSLDFPMILGCFTFFFIGGYLLYGSLFAAVGSAVDSETDTQQFMLPITIPLIIGFMIASSAINDPESTIAVWASIIPFTSPIVMMVRIPFGVPTWQLVLSMVLLVVTFIGCIWLAGRIYRVGVLMYGKKVTYKELSKWLFYKI